MSEPTAEETREFWEGRGIKKDEGNINWDNGYPCYDSLDDLFKYAPNIVVGVYFRYHPGRCECELTYMTEAGFDTVESWVRNETGDEKESRKLSALALFRALQQVQVMKEVK